MPQMAPLMWLPLLVLNLIMLLLIIMFVYFHMPMQFVVEKTTHSQSKYLNDNKVWSKEDKLFLNKTKWQYQF
nr:TPA_asm: ATP synthase F0 subunit 8 [Pseudomyrmex veneficus]